MTADSQDITDINRYNWLQSHDVADLYSVLDSGLVAHLGYIRDDYPVIIPMSYVRDGHSILVHGSSGARLSMSASGGFKMSATITIIDGLVYEFSLYNSTVNYRSVMVFGEAFPVPPEEKEEAVRLISERLMPGRWDETPRPTKKELASTAVLRLSLDNSSVKIRKGGPSYEPVDGVWTGHVPLKIVLGDAVTQPLVDVPVSSSVAKAHELFRGFAG